MAIQTEKCVTTEIYNPVNELDLPIFIPKYQVTDKGYEFGETVFVVHLRRFNVKLPLFLRSFYLACYTYYASMQINPESKFVRMHYKKNYYTYYKGKKRKNTKQRSSVNPYLSWQKVTSTYKGNKSIYFFVTSRYNDPNSKANFGFSIHASSLTVRLFICKEMIRKIGDPNQFDFAKFFEDFLYKINYHKAVYMTSLKYNSIHRLHALQHDLLNVM